MSKVYNITFYYGACAYVNSTPRPLFRNCFFVLVWARSKAFAQISDNGPTATPNIAAMGHNNLNFIHEKGTTIKSLLSSTYKLSSLTVPTAPPWHVDFIYYNEVISSVAPIAGCALWRFKYGARANISVVIVISILYTAKNSLIQL